MIKKLLFIAFLCTVSIGFSQSKSIDKLVATPNPFVNSTKITFTSEKQQNIVITVKNVLGKTVYYKKTEIKQGTNVIPFERGNLIAGMYIYSIQTQQEIKSKRFVIR